MNNIIITDSSDTIQIANDSVNILLSGQGAQGVPGVGVPPGGETGQALVKASNTSYDTEWATINGANVSGIAGQIVSALKMVYNDTTTSKLLYADKDSIASVVSLLGMTTQAGAEDSTVNVLTYGEFEDTSWAWDMLGNVALYLGSNGDIVQGAPTGLVLERIGYAISPTSIFIRLGEPIITI